MIVGEKLKRIRFYLNEHLNAARQALRSAQKSGVTAEVQKEIAMHIGEMAMLLCAVGEEIEIITLFEEIIYAETNEELLGALRKQSFGGGASAVDPARDRRPID